MPTLFASIIGRVRWCHETTNTLGRFHVATDKFSLKWNLVDSLIKALLIYAFPLHITRYAVV